MKKNYIQPEAIIVPVKTTSMIATSDINVTNSNATKSGDYYNESRAGNGGGWDDEE